MRRPPERRVLLLVLLAWGIAGAEEAAFLVTFDRVKIAPGTVCNGEAAVAGGRLVGLVPVLFEAHEKAEGATWQCSLTGTKTKPWKRPILNTMPRSKGIVVKMRGAGTVRLKTSLGEVAFRPGDVPWGGEKRFLEGKVAVQRVPCPDQLSAADTEDEFPAVACDRSGRVWAAWQSWDAKADSLLAARRENGVWSKPTRIVGHTGDFYRVRLAPAGDGVRAVWAEQREGNWDLWALRLPPKPGAKPMRLTTGAGTDFNHVLATTSAGDTWMAWQAESGGQYDIHLARLTDAGLADIVQVTDHPANDWEPAIALRPDGSSVIAWDTYRNGSYDVYLKTVAKGRASDAVAVACTAAYEAHASVACGPKRRIWVAWDNGGAKWGKHARPAPLLHRTRRVELCCLDGGKRLVPKTPLASCLTPDLRGLWELPQVTFDAAGRPVVLFRALAPIQRWNVLRKSKERQTRGIWAYFATTYEGGSWSRPALLSGSEGRNDQRPCIARAPDGRLWVACAGDGRSRTRAEIPISNNVFVCSLRHETAPAPTPALAPAEAAPKPVDLRERPRKPHSVTLRGQTYTLVYGDTHRHTDISRCNMNHDGSLLDTYRYAIDAVAIDFLAISDHDQDILKHRYDRKQRALQDYMWWRSEKLVDLFHMHDGFIALYGYEHGGSFARRGGHKNVVYAKRGNPCFEVDAPKGLFEALKGRNAVAIPHQLADGGSATDWSQWNAEFETVAEVFQARGSYEFGGCPREVRVKRPGHYYWDALAKGLKIGAIASSDHGLTHSAYAGVYVKERTREGVLEGLKARRTFGATDTIVLELRLGDRFMGEEAAVSAPPKLEAVVLGTAELDRVDIVSNGQFVYTVDPDGPTSRFEFVDVALKPGQQAYYCLRCVQANNELAWSSPIWVTRK